MLVAQDFVAMDLQDGNGEYCPQFDSQKETVWLIPTDSKIEIEKITDALILSYYYGEWSQPLKIIR